MSKAKTSRSILMRGAALSLALNMTLAVPLVSAQEQTGTSTEVTVALDRVEEARRALEEARATNGDVAAAEAALADAEAELAAAQQAAAQEPAQPAADAAVTTETEAGADASASTPPATEPTASEPAPTTTTEPAPTTEPAAPTTEAGSEPTATGAQTEPAPTATGDQAEPAAAPAPPAAEPTAQDTETTAPPAGEQPAEPATQPSAPPAQSTEPATQPQTAPEQPAAQSPTEAQPAPADTQPQAQEQTAPAQEQAQPQLTPEQLRAAQEQSAEQARREAEQREAAKSRAERERDEEERRRILGAAAAGLAVGALVPILGGQLVEQQGDRIIIQRGDQFIVRKDETERLLIDGSTVEVEELAQGRTRVTVTRPDGTQIITLRDPGGYLVRRVKRLPNGDEIVLFDDRGEVELVVEDFDETLPPFQLSIPPEEYALDLSDASIQEVETVLLAPPVESVERAYTLREVRESERLRQKVRYVDLDTLTFETNSAQVSADQARALDEIGQTLSQIIAENPEEVFLIEGHTDAVGSDLYNLTLSDRRAETVASLLTELYDVPPENLVTQGYGEQDLKVPTLGAERENRRVAVRRITPLLQTSAR
jgi:outer membrane protein OmpA-like peptidoglycan-associated protein